MVKLNKFHTFAILTSNNLYMKKSIITSLSCMPFLSLLSAQDRPNIIVFLVDDMGLMDTSVPFIVNNDGEPEMQPLNEWYRTPNMERLAAQGVRFSTFYAQSVSSPSRTSMMTGQNAARHHTTNWINSESNNRDTYGPYEWNWRGLERTDMIYPLVLSKAGYKTIHIGKAHFGCFGSEGEDPIKLGFDVILQATGKELYPIWINITELILFFQMRLL